MGWEIRRSRTHCPQLVASEEAPVLSDADLGEDRVARTLKPNDDNDQQEDRRESHKEQGAGQDVEKARFIFQSLQPNTNIEGDGFSRINGIFALVSISSAFAMQDGLKL